MTYINTYANSITHVRSFLYNFPNYSNITYISDPYPEDVSNSS